MGRASVPEANEVQDTTICWQNDGPSILGRKSVIMLDFLPKSSTITVGHYANLLDQMRNAIREKSLKVFCCNRTTRKSWARGYKTFFMLNSIEHEIFPAHKC